jgi:Fe-S-cluster formation regulator IscX/YfhJ
MMGRYKVFKQGSEKILEAIHSWLEEKGITV